MAVHIIYDFEIYTGTGAPQRRMSCKMVLGKVVIVNIAFIIVSVHCSMGCCWLSAAAVASACVIMN